MSIRRHRDPTLAAMGDFLSGYPWAHYLTLTFRPPTRAPIDPKYGQPWGRFSPRHDPSQPVALPYAIRNWQQFNAKVRRDAGVPIFSFFGIEYGERRGRLHLHALMGNTERIPIAVLQENWRAGFSRVEIYDPRQGAGHYVAKYVTKELADWDISDSPIAAGHIALQRRIIKRDTERLTAAAQARWRAKERAERTATHQSAIVEQLTLSEGPEHG